MLKKTDYYTPKDITKYFDYKNQTVRAWMHKKKFSYIKEGKFCYIPKEEFHKFLKNRVITVKAKENNNAK